MLESINCVNHQQAGRLGVQQDSIWIFIADQSTLIIFQWLDFFTHVCFKFSEQQPKQTISSKYLRSNNVFGKCCSCLVNMSVKCHIKCNTSVNFRSECVWKAQREKEADLRADYFWVVSFNVVHGSSILVCNPLSHKPLLTPPVSPAYIQGREQ